MRRLNAALFDDFSDSVCYRVWFFDFAAHDRTFGKLPEHERQAVGQKGRRDRTIGEAGIQMSQMEMLRQAARERALAGCCRSVNGDNHAASLSPRVIEAPIAANRDVKVGKLVAITAPSSTVTGFSLASPRTRKDIAMR